MKNMAMVTNALCTPREQPHVNTTQFSPYKQPIHKGPHTRLPFRYTKDNNRNIPRLHMVNNINNEVIEAVDSARSHADRAAVLSCNNSTNFTHINLDTRYSNRNMVGCTVHRNPHNTRNDHNNDNNCYPVGFGVTY